MTRTVNISGFITISVPMDALNNLASQLVQKIEIIFLIILSAALLMMMASFWYFTYRPLKAINRGVGEFSSGNLSYKISASGSNEMSYLSKALNQMAAELKKSNDYQKDFISNVSHDFRSPLTSIKGFAKAMTDGTIPPEMYEKYLNIISQETDRLSKLTKSIMDLNNLNAGKLSLHFTDFDLNRMLKDTVSVFEGSCRDKMLQINLIQTGASTIVHADKEKIEQVIYNLLDNAVKFSERGSVIKVETTLHRNKCFVSIKDQGCGIPKESLPMIWDRFYKADISRGRDRKGTGLGLSIVKEIITAHGQTINVVSTVGVGTEFEFSLDLA